jgi:hypothetical protein
MFSNQLAKDWKYKWFGFWGAEEKYIGRCYKREDYVDISCPTKIREKIVLYLSSAPMVLVGQVPLDECGFCDEPLHPASYRSDGVWLWPDRLSHDVAKHDFCVPNAMVEHILEHDGVPIQDFDIPWEELPWP